MALGQNALFGGEGTLKSQPSLHTGLSGSFSGVRIHGPDTTPSSPPDDRAEYDMPLDMSANPRRESVFMDEGTWNLKHQVQRCVYEWERFSPEVRVPIELLARVAVQCSASEDTGEFDFGTDTLSNAARDIGQITTRVSAYLGGREA